MPTELRERGDWTTGTDFGDKPEYEHEVPVIGDRVRRRTHEEWVRLLGDAEIPFAPTLTLEEALNSEHAKAEGVLREFELHGHKAWAPVSPVRVRDTVEPQPTVPLPAPPDLGEHTEQVLRELGLDDLVGRT